MTRDPDLYKRSESMRELAMRPRSKPRMRSGGRGGWKLRAERVRAGITQVEMARRLDIPPALLSMLEHELVRLPRGFMTEYREALHASDSMHLRADERTERPGG